MLNGDKVIADIERDLSLEEKIAVLEAQAAAMRRALEWYACEGAVDCHFPKMKDGSCQVAACGDACGDIAFKALSTDAGRKMLAVVTRMRELVSGVDAGQVQITGPEITGPMGEAPHDWAEEWLHLTRQDLAAMDKP